MHWTECTALHCTRLQQREPSSQTGGLFYSGGTALKLYSRRGWHYQCLRTVYCVEQGLALSVPPYCVLCRAGAGIISAAVLCAVQLQLLIVLFQTNPYPSKDGSGGGEMAGWGGASLPPTAGYYAGYDHPTLAAYG